jgi:hypothetical protein
VLVVSVQQENKLYRWSLMTSGILLTNTISYAILHLVKIIICDNQQQNLRIEAMKMVEENIEKMQNTPTQKKKLNKEKILQICTYIMVFVMAGTCFFSGFTIGKTQSIKNNDFDYIKALLDEHYVLSEYDQDFANYNSINAYLDTIGDKYAYYLSAEEYAKKTMSQSGEDVSLGIKFVLDENRRIIVSEIIKGGNAEKSNLLVGDYLLSIKGQPTSNYDEYVKFSTTNIFKDGEKVEVIVERNNQKVTANITTNKKVIPLCEYRLIDNIAYIKLSTFSEKSAEDCSNIIKEINKNCAALKFHLYNLTIGVIIKT